MSYRKITVNGKQYEFVVGKVNTKIKNVGVYENSKIGILVDRNDDIGIPYSEWDPDWRLQAAYAVTPAVVRGLIEQHAK